MQWTTPEYVKVLHANLQDYFSAKKDSRTKVLENTLDAIKAIAEKGNVGLPSDITKKIEIWFQNHRPHVEGKKAKHGAQDARRSTTWTVRRLVKELMDDQIAALLAKKYPEHVPGSQEYLRHYPACWSEVVNGLSEEKRRELEEKAEKWNAEGTDESLHPRIANKHFHATAQKFMLDVYKNMGVHVFMLVGYKDDSGDLVKAKLESSFDNFLPSFNNAGDDVWNAWDEYLEKKYKETSKDAEEDDPKSSKPADKSVPWSLKLDKKGYPLLPDIQGLSLSQVKNIVRSYLTLCYRKKAHNPKAVIPWGAISRAPDDFFDARYLPDGVTLEEISKMKSNQVHACLHKWIKDQENGRRGFHFRTVASGDLRHEHKKRKRSESVDVTPDNRKQQKKHSEFADVLLGNGQQEQNHLESVDDTLDNGQQQQNHSESVDVTLDSGEQEKTGSAPIRNTGKGKLQPVLIPADVPNIIQDQIDFLLSLSKEKEYISLLACAEQLPVQSKAFVTSRPSPKWASWSYKAKHLPPAFHADSKPFEDFITWLKTMPYCSQAMVAYSLQKVLTVCLGIGLVLRDLQTIQFELGDDDEDMATQPISYLGSSKLTWAHTNALLQTCTGIEADLIITQDEAVPAELEGWQSKKEKEPEKVKKSKRETKKAPVR